MYDQVVCESSRLNRNETMQKTLPFLKEGF